MIFEGANGQRMEDFELFLSDIKYIIILVVNQYSHTEVHVVLY